jgi:hypothetical protein
MEAAQAERDASNKAICDFIRETEPYKRSRAAAYFQRHRVEWAIEEARSMETDVSQQAKKAGSNTKGNTKESKKRRLDDQEEKEMVPMSQSKRAKARLGGEDAASGATKDIPQTRSFRRSTTSSK